MAVSLFGDRFGNAIMYLAFPLTSLAWEPDESASSFYLLWHMGLAPLRSECCGGIENKMAATYLSPVLMLGLVEDLSNCVQAFWSAPVENAPQKFKMD
jgi:hypothetical protein